MQVRKCKECNHYERRRWAQYYEPANYHAIGFTHAYGYCKKYGKRCSDVTNCAEVKSNGRESI